MLLGEPQPTRADLYFRLLGFPVRIHPFFWVMGVLLGMTPGPDPPLHVLIWVISVFVSILAHELGHAVLQKRYGGHPRITLYGLGGLAACDDCDRSTSAQITIALAGPVAGFLLAFAVLVGLALAGCHPQVLFAPTVEELEAFYEQGMARLSFPFSAVVWEGLSQEALTLFVADLLMINVLWGVINLLPIYPLDGGQISREICTLGDPRRGIVLSLQISFAFAVLMAGVGVLVWHSLFTAVLFGMLAYSSYRTLQAYQSSRW